MVTIDLTGPAYRAARAALEERRDPAAREAFVMAACAKRRYDEAGAVLHALEVLEGRTAMRDLLAAYVALCDVVQERAQVRLALDRLMEGADEPVPASARDRVVHAASAILRSDLHHAVHGARGLGLALATRAVDLAPDWPSSHQALEVALTRRHRSGTHRAASRARQLRTGLASAPEGLEQDPVFDELFIGRAWRG